MPWVGRTFWQYYVFLATNVLGLLTHSCTLIWPIVKFCSFLHKFWTLIFKGISRYFIFLTVIVSGIVSLIVYFAWLMQVHRKATAFYVVALLVDNLQYYLLSFNNFLWFLGRWEYHMQTILISLLLQYYPFFPHIMHWLDLPEQFV